MRNLIRFINRYSFFFLFLLFEVFAFSLLINNNHFQQSAFLNAVNTLSGSTYQTISNWQEYIHLKEDNLALSEALKQAKSHNKNQLYPVFGNQLLIDDTLYQKQFKLIQAKIINNSVHRQNNIISLNKGSLNGIESGMGIIGPQGVVGVVKNVSEHFSTAISVLHRNAKISAKLKEQDYFGSLQWNGKDPKIGTLLDIPNHVQLEEGDTVSTSGFSATFPPSIPIGIVKSFEIEEGENFYHIELTFINDFQKLNHVFVVKNVYRDELENLEKQTLSEDE